MHGTFKQIITPTVTDFGGGWTPYIPSFFRRREVIRQLGHKPTLYVMRKQDGNKWLYRPCTPSEQSAIEFQEGRRN